MGGTMYSMHSGHSRSLSRALSRARGKSSISRAQVLCALDEALLSDLECPECMEYMVPPIKLCNNGHNICSE
jgi:uncharacterized OB-fold protein